MIKKNLKHHNLQTMVITKTIVRAKFKKTLLKAQSYEIV